MSVATQQALPGRVRRPVRLGRARPWRVVAWALVAGVPLAFLAVFFALPVVGLVARGFVTDGALDLSAFGEVMSRSHTWRIIEITVGQAVVGTTFAVALGVPGAHC